MCTTARCMMREREGSSTTQSALPARRCTCPPETATADHAGFVQHAASRGGPTVRDYVVVWQATAAARQGHGKFWLGPRRQHDCRWAATGAGTANSAVSPSAAPAAAAGCPPSGRPGCHGGPPTSPAGQGGQQDGRANRATEPGVVRGMVRGGEGSHVGIIVSCDISLSVQHCTIPQEGLPHGGPS